MITLHGPDGKVYTLNPLGTNQLCDLELRLGKHFGQVMGEIGALGLEHMRLGTVRLFLQTCLTEPTTEEEIGALVDFLGFDGISGAINGLIVPAEQKAAA